VPTRSSRQPIENGFQMNRNTRACRFGSEGGRPHPESTSAYRFETFRLNRSAINSVAKTRAANFNQRSRRA
jgi:hypothetical protein